MKEYIYIIAWTGRDSDSGVWDTYPCFEYGAFLEKSAALKTAYDLNVVHPGKYDADADDTEGYIVQDIAINA